MPHFFLGQCLLNESKFDGLVWGPNEVHPDHLLVDEGSGNICILPPRVTWAVSHSHLPMFVAELRGPRGIRTLCSALLYVRLALRMGNRLRFDRAMCLKLFRTALVFRAADVANALLELAEDIGYKTHTFLESFFNESDLADTNWILSLENFSLQSSQLPIVEVMCRARDVQALEMAIARKADVDLYIQQHPLAQVLETMESEVDVTLAAQLLKAKCRLKACEGMSKEIYWYLHFQSLPSDGKTVDLDPFSGIMRSGWDSLSIGRRATQSEERTSPQRASPSCHVELAMILMDVLKKRELDRMLRLLALSIPEMAETPRSFRQSTYFQAEYLIEHMNGVTSPL